MHTEDYLLIIQLSQLFRTMAYHRYCTSCQCQFQILLSAMFAQIRLKLPSRTLTQNVAQNSQLQQKGCESFQYSLTKLVFFLFINIILNKLATFYLNCHHSYSRNGSIIFSLFKPGNVTKSPNGLITFHFTLTHSSSKNGSTVLSLFGSESVTHVNFHNSTVDQRSVQLGVAFIYIIYIYIYISFFFFCISSTRNL